MKTLHWKHTGWNPRDFLLTIGNEIVGQLTFTQLQFWNFQAVYTDKEINFRFSQKGFWDRDVLVTKNGSTLGEINFGVFGTQTLKLSSGEQFTLSSSFWEQELYWANEKGDTLVKYQQATMSSLSKGLISVNNSLSVETEKLLISSGLFIRKVIKKRRTLLVVMVILLAAASRGL